MKEIDWHIPRLGIVDCNIYTGGHNWLRFSLQRKGEEIAACVWPQPWAIEKTDPDLVLHHAFPFTEEGLAQVAPWLQEQYAFFPADPRENIFAVLPADWKLPWVQQNREERLKREEAEKAQQEAQDEAK